MSRRRIAAIAASVLLVPLAVVAVSTATALPANAGNCRIPADVNGDGVSDLLVGQVNRGNGGDPHGAVSVILGNASGGVTGVGSQLVTNPSLGITPRSEDLFGIQVVTGFFNNDCYADALVGATQYAGAGPGSIVEVFGSPSGLNLSTGHRFIASQFAAGAFDIGSQITVGDFNGDGYDDAALGAAASNGSKGGVAIIYGSATGLVSAHTQWFTEGAGGVPGAAAPNNDLGSAVVAGDFDRNGYTDLAIGVPVESVSGHAGAGAVIVLRGTAAGLTSNGSSIISEGTTGVPGVPEAADNFGGALVSGDVTGDGYPDLAVGAPGEVDHGAAGAVFLLTGSSVGLTSTGSQFRDQDSSAFPQFPIVDNMGSALAIADVDGDGYADIACGAGSTDVDGAVGAGAFAILYGSPSGMTTSSTDILSQDSPGVPGVAEYNDQFGDALKTLPVTDTGYPGLMVAAPGESSNGGYENGGIEVFNGAAVGITGAGSAYLDGSDVAGGIVDAALMGATWF